MTAAQPDSPAPSTDQPLLQPLELIGDAAVGACVGDVCTLPAEDVDAGLDQQEGK